MFTLDRVVPWGRSFDEYQRMFALTEADLLAGLDQTQRNADEFVWDATLPPADLE
jgi:hypothetical protein